MPSSQAARNRLPALPLSCLTNWMPSREADFLDRPRNKFFSSAFVAEESRPLAVFAGIWTSVRKVKEGETTNALFGFLTTEPNAEVGAVHPKAMPVILTTPDEMEKWMTAPVADPLKRQRPLGDGALRVVARGVKKDSD